MSTVVLTLVVVGGSIVVATRMALVDGSKPATETAAPHRGPSRRERRRRRREAPVVEAVRPHPGVFTRLGAGVGIAMIVVLVGAAIALSIVVGAGAISSALEGAVQ